MNSQVYFYKNPMPNPDLDTVDGSDAFIAIRHGDNGYCRTTVYHQSHADELNRRAGVSRAQCEAAYRCSVMASIANSSKPWDMFETLAAQIQANTDEAERIFPCTHGHNSCSKIEGGPCFDEQEHLRGRH